ncbi:arsenate reductase family protein [Paenibacillus sp. J2TS4]|uniref:arsenate reductase family protein n=1 Tax=Paenibacillus sp. J2TS4 TaxID=2807194 RepID=UPI001B07202F|nr:arsenate reductase family protein [Paenibacillus sp. J2TS4]GIP34359.1 hypothetical protein J2TS4_35690 [Paenibacillus sp. J2TS4]
MKLKMYGYPKCSTCRNALKWLQSKGHEVTTVNVFEEPPSEEELTDLLSKSGLELKKFFNTSGEVYKEMNLKDKLGQMSVEEQIRLLASNGRLIKRPVVTDGSRVTVGFKEELYKQVWE